MEVVQDEQPHLVPPVPLLGVGRGVGGGVGPVPGRDIVHPAVIATSAETRSPQLPPTSCWATQKKPPPLHPYSPPL